MVPLARPYDRLEPIKSVYHANFPNPPTSATPSSGEERGKGGATPSKGGDRHLRWSELLPPFHVSSKPIWGSRQRRGKSLFLDPKVAEDNRHHIRSNMTRSVPNGSSPPSGEAAPPPLGDKRSPDDDHL